MEAVSSGELEVMKLEKTTWNLGASGHPSIPSFLHWSTQYLQSVVLLPSVARPVAGGEGDRTGSSPRTMQSGWGG